MKRPLSTFRFSANLDDLDLKKLQTLDSSTDQIEDVKVTEENTDNNNGSNSTSNNNSNTLEVPAPERSK